MGLNQAGWRSHASPSADSWCAARRPSSTSWGSAHANVRGGSQARSSETRAGSAVYVLSGSNRTGTTILFTRPATLPAHVDRLVRVAVGQEVGQQGAQAP